jgi:hypothetical protein
MSKKINLTKVQLSWTMDILGHIQKVLESDSTETEKIQSIRWLVKQALKSEKEE